MSYQLFLKRVSGKKLFTRGVHFSKNYPKNLPPSKFRQDEGEKRLKANRVLREDIASGEPCLPPEQAQYLSLIQSFYKDKTPARALKTLEHAREKKQVHAKHFGAVIKACNRAKAPQKALEVLQKMKADDIQPNVVIYSSLLHGFAKKKDLIKTQALFQDMLSSGVEPNLVTYSSLIHAHSVHGDIQGVKRVYREMLDRNIFPDAYIISDMISACAADANLAQAYEFFDLVSRLKITPYVGIYHAYMKCARSAEKPSVCMKLYDKLIEAGLTPTLGTYSHVLSSLSKPETSYEFNYYWNKMIEEFQEPDEYCWGAKMNLLNLQSKFREVLEIGSKIKHSRVTHHEMIRSYLGLNDLKGAQQYFEALQRRTHEHYRALIVHFIKTGDYISLDDIFKRGIDAKELRLKVTDDELDLHFFDRYISLAAIRYVINMRSRPFSIDLLCGRGLDSGSTLKDVLPEFVKDHLDVRLKPSTRKPEIAYLMSI